MILSSEWLIGSLFRCLPIFGACRFILQCPCESSRESCCCRWWSQIHLVWCSLFLARIDRLSSLHSPTPLGMKLGGNFHFHFRARRAQNVQNVQTAIKLRPPRKSWKCLCCCGGVLRFERYWWAPWGNKRFLSKRAGFRRGPWLNWLSTRPSSLSAVLPNSLAGQNWKTQNSSQPNLVHK